MAGGTKDFSDDKQLTEEVILKEAVLMDLPEGDTGAKIVTLAFSRLGDPYSQEKAGVERY